MSLFAVQKLLPMVSSLLLAALACAGLCASMPLSSVSELRLECRRDSRASRVARVYVSE
jgi:hypothetical protein